MSEQRRFVSKHEKSTTAALVGMADVLAVIRSTVATAASALETDRRARPDAAQMLSSNGVSVPLQTRMDALRTVVEEDTKGVRGERQRVRRCCSGV